MRRFRHFLVTAVVCAIVVIGILSGWFKVFDDALRDMRFAVTSRPASGDIVFVEIDAAAMANVGSASRARNLYASVVDRLVQGEVALVVLDVTLRGTLGYFDDNALAGALTRAKGSARTVAHLAEGSDPGPLSLPLDRFAAVAPPVFVDTEASADGVFRSYRTRIMQDGWVIESLATALTPGRTITAGSFLIDYGIDFSTLPRITISDLLSGEVDPASLAGRKVVIGLSGYSLQNGAMTPRYGMLPTTSIQLLAAETVRQNRMLMELGPVPSLLIVIGVGLIFSLLRRRMSLVSAIAGSVAYAAVLEFTAMALHTHSGLIFDTAAVHIAQLGFIFAAFGHELERQGRSLSHTTRERDSMRGILARVVADNFDGVVVVDHNGRIRAASKLAEEFVGSDLLGRPARDVLPAVFHTAIAYAFEKGEVMERSLETTIPGKDGERIVEFVVALSSVDDEDVSAESAGRVACLTFRDVTERRHVEERLTYLAGHDPLTGAMSRARFVEMIDALLATPTGRMRGVSVFLLGLTRLKTINDSLGHAYGDELLKQVAERLEQTGTLCLARLEGNSFGLLFEGRFSEQDGMIRAEQVLESICHTYVLDGHHAIVGGRIGMTDSDLSGTVPDTLISHASMALSIASDLPGNSIVTFAKEMDTRVKNKREMETALRVALTRGEFAVHYQPQLDLESSEVIGVEALARWTHPQLGNVSPAQFIPAAEETGLIIELGRWVLHSACAEVVKWPKPVRLSVNVSPLQFEHGDIVADVQSALAESGLAAVRLDIEITESLLVAETSHVIDKLNQLREMGVRVALDDFGTGYCSLGYLGRLPVDKIKIDQRFVRGLPEDNEATAIVRAVLMLSESLGKDVVAEGIETHDQAWLLRLAGCRIGQGFFFARPAPAEVIVARMIEDADDAMHQIQAS